MKLSHFHLLESIWGLVSLLDQYTKLIEPFNGKVLFYLTNIFSREGQNSSISVSLHTLCMKMPSVLAAYFSTDIWVNNSFFFFFPIAFSDFVYMLYTREILRNCFCYISPLESFFQLWAAADFRWASKPRKRWNFAPTRESSSTKKPWPEILENLSK